MKDEEKLKELYKKADMLNEENPHELLQKMKLYGEILGITGRLHAASLKEWKLCEALRKEAAATCFTYDPEGTMKEREMKAEFACSEHRKKEAMAEGECMRWRNAYTSTTELIQIYKLQLRDMKDIGNGGI